MPETRRVTFQFGLGQVVQHAGDRFPWRVVGRVWEEREMLGPVVWYRLLRMGVTQSAYEPDLVPVEKEGEA